MGLTAHSASWLAAAPASASEPQETVVYLLRHAEKVQTSDPDPELTLQGQRRALQLADQLEGVPIDRVYSSEYRRTLETVAPLASRLGIEIERYDARDSEALVEKVMRDAAGQTVVISGHSNTVPALASLFGYEPELTIRDSDYGDLFRLRVTAEGTEMTRLRFGD